MTGPLAYSLARCYDWLQQHTNQTGFKFKASLRIYCNCCWGLYKNNCYCNHLYRRKRNRPLFIRLEERWLRSMASMYCRVPCWGSRTLHHKLPRAVESSNWSTSKWTSLKKKPFNHRGNNLKKFDKAAINILNSLDKWARSMELFQKMARAMEVNEVPWKKTRKTNAWA